MQNISVISYKRFPAISLASFTIYRSYWNWPMKSLVGYISLYATTLTTNQLFPIVEDVINGVFIISLRIISHQGKMTNFKEKFQVSTLLDLWNMAKTTWHISRHNLLVLLLYSKYHRNYSFLWQNWMTCSSQMNPQNKGGEIKSPGSSYPTFPSLVILNRAKSSWSLLR